MHNVTKPDDRRSAIIHRLTDHVLAHGLLASSLRSLAKAAGTSDRMLLYYFRDKAEIMEAVLTQLSARLVALLGDHANRLPMPLDDVRRELAAFLFTDDLWPYMRVWLEIAARAAMGDQFYRAVGEQIGRGFLAWGRELLSCADEAERDSHAARLLVSLEGMLFLKSIGLDDVNAAATAN
ncbi:MAG: TetR/AcrR family transcriptional regulator [Sphingorhabdus sp.]